MHTHRLIAVSALTVTTLLAACGGSGGHDEKGVSMVEAVAAMNTILDAYPEAIGYHHELSHWGFATPDGDKAEWTSDLAANTADVAFVFLEEPLVAAGVDPDALVAQGWIRQAATTGEMPSPARLIKTWDLGSKASGMDPMDDTAGMAFERLLMAGMDRLGFHHEMMHFGLALGGGDKLEWTADLSAGDADLAFVLGAQQLIDAGADLDLLQAGGWIYAAANGSTPALLIKPVALD